MNIYDISKKAGVSIATVSRVLNDSDRVSEATRQKVLSVIQEQNYTPNAFARGLGLDTMRTVGILYADVSDMYLANAVYHLERRLRQNDYDSLICCTGYDLADKKKYLRLLLSKRVDAVILAGSYYVGENDAQNDYIRKAAQIVPVAILNGRIQGDNIYCAICDDYNATYDMTLSLLSSGSKELVYLYHSMSDSTRRKLSGLRAAYSSVNVGSDFPDDRIFRCPFRDVYECAAFVKSLRSQLSFDTIMASDDALAVGAVKYARASGIEVPKGLRVAGYNNSVLSKCCVPELTTVDNKMEELCSSIVDMLMYRLAGDNIPSNVTLSGEIVPRAST